MEERIAFVTDLHIGLESDLPRGIDTRKNFTCILDELKARKPEYLIIGGDLCFMNPEVAVYGWIKEKLDATGIPFFIIPGNHDDPEMIAKIFPGVTLSASKEIFYAKRFKYNNILFLDSSPGKLSEDQFKWLEDQIRISEHKEIFIVIHHPPILSHSLHMDSAYAFQQTDRFVRTCQTTPEKNYYIFSGHYHIERYIKHGNINVFITPSLFVQIDPDQDRFVPFANQGIGYREIVFASDEKWYTSVLYLITPDKF